MKYDKDMYIDSGLFGCDEDLEHYKEKVVKCRKPHACNYCKKEIKAGDYALNESAFFDGKPVSSYTCLECVEEWLEESGQVETEESEE